VGVGPTANDRSHLAHRVADPALHALLATLTTPACVLQADGKIVATSVPFDRLMGTPAGGLVGHVLLRVLQPVGRDLTSLPTLAAAVAEGRAAGSDVLIRTAAPRPSWFGLLMEPIAIHPGHTLVLFTDASQRVRENLAAERGRNVLHSVVGFAERLLQSPRWNHEMPLAFDALGRAIHAAAISVYRLDGEAVSLVASWRNNELAPIHPAWLEAGPWYSALAVGEPTLLDELPRPGVAAVRQSHDGQLALFPIDVGSERWGVLIFDRSDGLASWTSLEQLACRSVAHNLAAAVARERRENVITAERSFVRQVLDGVDDGVWVVDEQQRVVFANRAMHELLGIPPNALVGASQAAAWDQLSPNGPAPHAEAGGFELERNGKVLFVRILERRFGDGATRRFVVATDISSRTDAERSLKAAVVNAERASEAKTHFLGRVSHELRTPLQVVIGFARLVEMDAPEQQGAEHAKEIIAAAHHLERMVGDLIDLSSAESGELSLSFMPVELTALVRDVIEALVPVAGARGAKLALKAAPAVTVVADKGRVRQVVFNLLSNAVKFTRPRSTIHVEVGLSDTDPLGVVTVRDEGAGFPPAELDRLFVPFERLSNASGVEGAGLGLAMSHILAQRMGGALSATNAREGGALLTLTLPLVGQASGEGGGNRSARRSRAPAE
jgi:PAS domain S-box-containing protein